jgi:hypothetical protein
MLLTETTKVFAMPRNTQSSEAIGKNAITIGILTMQRCRKKYLMNGDYHNLWEAATTDKNGGPFGPPLL